MAKQRAIDDANKIKRQEELAKSLQNTTENELKCVSDNGVKNTADKWSK